MSFPILAFVTCPPGKGHSIASKLVEEKLAACVSIMPNIESIYRWQGAVHSGPEELLMIKTDATIWNIFENRVKALHPYEVPEIISCKIENGYAPYLEWIKDNVKITNT